MARGASMRWMAIPLILALSPSALAQPIRTHAAQPTAAQSDEALKLLERGIAFRTVIGTPAGTEQIVAYANFLKAALVGAGLAEADVVVAPRGNTATLVARLRGNGTKRPILLNGHMDVVEADPADWTRDPFTPVIENGYVYGRGSYDNKAGISVMVATLMRLAREGYHGSRDLILVLTGDEETAMVTTRALAQELRGANAEMLLNADAGGGLLDERNRPLIYGIQAGEKTYADFAVTFTDPGGHSSRPGATNAIYQLAQALDRLAAYHFPPQSNELTRAYFSATAPLVSGDLSAAMRHFAADPTDQAAIATLSADPAYVGQVRTTCVATMVRGGHAPNALPQNANATINCRIFPGTSIESVQAKLTELVGPGARISIDDAPVASDASPLRADVMAALRKAIDARSPGLPISPMMEAGATDSMFFRALGIPSYGVGPVYLRADDDFAHGLNERVTVSSIAGGLAQWYVLLTELTK